MLLAHVEPQNRVLKIDDVDWMLKLPADALHMHPATISRVAATGVKMNLAYVTGSAEKQIVPTRDSILDRKLVTDVFMEPDVVAVYNKGILQCCIVWPSA